MNTRRDFLRKGAFAGLGMLTMSELAKAVVSKQNGNVSPKIKLEKDSVILFQGDSITDMFRKYDCNQCNTPEQMGMGYALFAASTLLSDYPDKQLKIYNRGVGGNKVYQLRDRWELDTLAIQPDVLSILIGVNDFWHILMGNYKGSLGIYERDLQDLLHYTKEKLPNVQLVLGSSTRIIRRSNTCGTSFFVFFTKILFCIGAGSVRTRFSRRCRPQGPKPHAPVPP